MALQILKNQEDQLIVLVYCGKNEVTSEIGLRELCWNNFENFEATQYSRIILRIIGE